MWIGYVSIEQSYITQRRPRSLIQTSSNLLIFQMMMMHNTVGCVIVRKVLGWSPTATALTTIPHGIMNDDAPSLFSRSSRDWKQPLLMKILRNDSPRCQCLSFSKASNHANWILTVLGTMVPNCPWFRLNWYDFLLDQWSKSLDSWPSIHLS